jgi:predicted nucleic acid-binding protein
MNIFRVAADSSCLIGLVQIDQLGILRDIFAEQYIPSAVYEEVIVRGKGKTGSDEIASAVRAGWLRKTEVRDIAAVNALTARISRGEAEVIVLTKEMNLDYALIDEKTARNIAAQKDVKTVGILGIIGMAAAAGFPIDKRDAVSRLRKAGFRMSEKLYQEILSSL